MAKHSDDKIAFGDFQTPLALAAECCRVAHKQFRSPSVVIEPTCGKGAFVIAAATQFPDATVIGYEINDSYRRKARADIRRQVSGDARPSIHKQDFFAADWSKLRGQHDGSVLFIGNPPWVTNSQLGQLGSDNLPEKSNRDQVRGIDALTGRSNFDISEVILERLLLVMRPRQDGLAMLVKTSMARKLLRSHWRRGDTFQHASIRRIDAKTNFGVMVDACLLMLQTAPKRSRKVQVCYASPALERPARQIAMGWFKNELVVDPVMAAETDCLSSTESKGDCLQWRSGVKHDVSRVVELSEIDGQIVRQDGKVIDIERGLLFPLAKGADVANNRTDCLTRRLLVTQRALNEATTELQTSHPATYRYLRQNRLAFANRKSSIYRGRDPYALFGIGAYTFQPWKIAICGLYKRLQFTILGPVRGQPVVTDDTCYSLSFSTAEQAEFVAKLLQSQAATDFFHARIFWDAKRPITADVLRRLDLAKLARLCGCQRKHAMLIAGQSPDR